LCSGLVGSSSISTLTIHVRNLNNINGESRFIKIFGPWFGDGHNREAGGGARFIVLFSAACAIETIGARDFSEGFGRLTPDPLNHFNQTKEVPQ